MLRRQAIAAASLALPAQLPGQDQDCPAASARLRRQQLRESHCTVLAQWQR